MVATAQERAAAWGELLQRSLPGAEAPKEDGRWHDWSERLRLPLALEDEMGRHIGASEATCAASSTACRGPVARSRWLEDGRTLWILRSLPRDGGFGDGPPRGPPDRSG